MHWENQFTHYTKVMGESLIRQLVATTKGIPGLISFAGGFPAPETFPKAELATIFARTISDFGEDVLQYGQSDGDNQLKAAIKKLENLVDLPDNQMLITCGSTNGIYYFARCLVEPGDVVICEGPTFLGTVVAFEAMGAKLRVVHMDEEGLKVDELEELLAELTQQGERVKFLYTIPEFQNPTGITMSLARRKALLTVADKYQLPILEDNPYGFLRYEGQRQPDIYRLAQTLGVGRGLVCCIKSFSKVLGPGLRLAYALGEEALIAKMCSWTQKVNVTPDCVSQRAVSLFINEGYMQNQLGRLAGVYRPRLQAMLAALQKHMPNGVTWTVPEGGMFIWIYLPANLDADELFTLAAQNKVSFVPGSKFYPQGCEKQNEMRLNFSYPSIEQIEEGVRRLGEIIATRLKSGN